MILLRAYRPGLTAVEWYHRSGGVKTADFFVFIKKKHIKLNKEKFKHKRNIYIFDK